MNVFSRSWQVTKLSFSVMKMDKEILLFPVLSSFFSLIFLFAMIFPTLILTFLNTGEYASDIVTYAILFAVYLGLAFIATFFNVCTVYTVKTRIEGGNASFMDSIRFAFSRIHVIFLWSLVSAIVGVLLRILENLARRLGSAGQLVSIIILKLIGIAWSIATIFVVPSLVYYNLGPFAAIKKSVETFKRTWGENILRFIGVGMITFILLFIGAVVFLFLFLFMISVNIWAGVAVIVLGVIYMIGIFLIMGVLESIFNVILFVYADTGKVPSGFDENFLKDSIELKNKI